MKISCIDFFSDSVFDRQCVFVVRDDEIHVIHLIQCAIFSVVYFTRITYMQSMANVHQKRIQVAKIVKEMFGDD